MNTTFTRETGTGNAIEKTRKAFTARRVLIAIVSLLAVFVIAPAAANANVGVSGSSGSTSTLANPIDFGSTPQGLLPKQVTIHHWNNGTFDGTSTTNFTVAGSGYRRNGGSCNGTATGLTWSSTFSSSIGTRSCTIILELQSGTAVGPAAGTMSFTSNKSISNGSSFTLSGTVVANNPVVQIWNSANNAEETSHPFPDTLSGTNSATYSFTIRNVGNVPLTNPSTQSITGADASSFSITATTCGATLAVLATCTITTRFNPPGATSTIARNATLNISPTFSGNPVTDSVDLSGNALAQTRIPALYDVTNTNPVSSFTYADTGVGSQANQTFTLRNTGNWVMAGPNNQSITGVNAGDYSITSTTCGATIASGGTCQITVQFAPTAGGNRAAALNVAPSDATSGSPAVINLNGIGVPPTFIPAIYDTAGTTLKPSHVFPDTVGTFQSAPYVFTLKNDGNAALLGTGAANQAITGPDAGQFNISATTCGASLLGGQSCTISVRFAPTTAAPDPSSVKNATLTVTTTNGVPISASSDISGTAIPATRIPAIYDTAGTTLEPSHVFPDTVGTLQSSPYVFTLKNTGNSTMTGTGAANQVITGPDANQFNISATTCAATLAAGASCTISMRFAPTTEAPDPASLKQATLSVNTTNGIPASASSAISGTSIPAISSPEIRDTANTAVLASRDLGSPAVSETNSYVFTLKNNGNVTLNGATLARQIISGPDAGQFSRSTTCGATLAANATCQITVNFSPTSTGPKTATLQVGSVNGDPVGSPIPGDPGSFFNTSITLTGTGVTPAPAVGIFDTAGTTPLTDRSFSSDLGSNSAYVFTVKNTGNLTLSGATNQTVTGLNSGDFSRTTTCGATLAIGASCTVTVTFTPSTSGPRTAVLTLSPTNVVVTPAPKSVDLNGTGTGVQITNDVLGTFTSGNSSKRWLDTVTTGGGAATGDHVRVGFEVDQNPAGTIEDVLVSNSAPTNDTAPADSTFNPVASGIANVQIQRRTGGRQALVLADVPATSFFGTSPGTYGFSAGFLNLCIGQTQKTNNRRVFFQLRMQDGSKSQKVGTIVRFIDGAFTCSGSPPIISDQQVTSVGGVAQPAKTMNAIANKNESLSFDFKGVADGTFTGINWRIRNSRTGDMFTKTPSGWAACASPCVADGSFSVANGSRFDYPAAEQVSGTVHTLNIPGGIPSRGRWIVEASPRGSNQDFNYPEQIGSVLVNDKGLSPTISLSGTPPARPNTNSAYSITATVSDPLDPVNAFDTQGGRPQIIEWDLNNNQTDGAAGDGFEVSHVGDSTTGIPASFLTKAFTTAGKTPGPYTIRARVVDNGSILAADNARRSAIASSTFTINSPPVARSETIDFEADETQPRPVQFNADDADNDPYTVNVTPNPGNSGSVAGAGNTKNYTWPSTFTGNDTFPYTATDDHAGTGPSGTLTVRVRPNTTIDVAAPNGSNPIPANDYLGASQSTDAEFSFSSPQTPVVGYDCLLKLDGNVIQTDAPCANGATGTFDYSNLADGLYRFEVRAINAAGQRDGTPAVRTWRVDTGAPVTSVKTGPPTDKPLFDPRPTNDPTPTYTFETADASVEEYVTYECRVLYGSENGIWKPCAAPSTPTGSGDFTLAGPGTDFGYTGDLPEGVYDFEIRATDDVGLTGPVLAQSFRVDLTPPVTSIASGPDGLINTRDVVFQITSTEADSTFLCELEGANQGIIFAEAYCPGYDSPAFNGLADDEYTLTITAVDPATNRDPVPPVATFEVDATEPVTTGGDVDFLDGAGVTASRRTQSRKIKVAFSGSDNRALQGFQCRLDSTDDLDWNTCQSPETYSGLPDGDHMLEIRAKDQAANVDSTPIEIEWTVDQTAPVTDITSSPSAHTNNASPSVDFSVNEPATSECMLDSGSWDSCASPVAVSSLNGGNPLNDGSHTFSIRSTDTAGNLENTAASVTWVQDTILPVVDFTGTPNPFVPQGDVDFGWSVKDGSPLVNAPEVETQCSLDGAGFTACDRSLTISDPDNGPHTFVVRATDQAGNAGADASYVFEVLGSPPVVPTIDNADPADESTTRLATANFAFSHPDENLGSFGHFECQIDNDPWSTCQSPRQYSGLGDGVHHFRLRAKDIADNISPVTTVDWEVQSGAPVTTIESGPSGLTQQTGATLTFSSSKDGTFECKVDGGTWNACVTPLELTGLSDGAHSVRVRAVSSVAPVGVKDPTPPVRTWTIDSTTPDTTVNSAPTGTTRDRTAQLTFSSNDPSAGFQCKVDDAEYDACSSPLNLTDVPIGVRTVAVRAIDEAGNADQTPEERTWTVEATPPPTCPVGKEGTPPNCTDPVVPEGDDLVATLSEGSLSLASLGEVALPAEQLVLTGVVGNNGDWVVPQGGVNFKPVEQTIPDALGPGQNVTVKISITATGPGSGTLPNGGGAADFVLPVQAKLEASLGSIPVIGPEADCYLRPIAFDLAGTYDEAGKKVTVASDSVSFPTVSAGCGALGGTVNGLIGLPRNDISIAMTFNLVRTPKVVDCPAGQHGTPPNCEPDVVVTPKPDLGEPVVNSPKKVKSGRKLKLTSSIKNSGDGAASNVKLCLKMPNKSVKGKATRCKTISSIAAGKTGSTGFTVRTKGSGKTKRVRYTVTATFSDGTSVKRKYYVGHVTLIKQ